MARRSKDLVVFGVMVGGTLAFMAVAFPMWLLARLAVALAAVLILAIACTLVAVPILLVRDRFFPKPPTCTRCANLLGDSRHEWNLDGKSQVVCDKCNARLESSTS